MSLIEQMTHENPLWSHRRIASELAKLGHRVDKDTVAKYMPRRPRGRPRRPPSQTWKTFIRNHLVGTIAIDFLTVPTVTFDIVYIFFVLSLERRRVLHVNVTKHPLRLPEPSSGGALRLGVSSFAPSPRSLIETRAACGSSAPNLDWADSVQVSVRLTQARVIAVRVRVEARDGQLPGAVHRDAVVSVP